MSSSPAVRFPAAGQPRFRVVIPAYPAFNVYSRVARETTALGPVCIATTVRAAGSWDVEVIDENNLRRHGPRVPGGGADHDFLQALRPAQVVGLYGGLTSTVPRLYELARIYREKGVVTIAGGQHFVDENIEEALRSGIDYVVIGEGETTILELLDALAGKRDLESVNGIAYRSNGSVVQTPPRPCATDFDQFPLPDFSLVRYAKIRIYPVERIRGCGMDCEFCTVKGRPRPATPERLLQQIDRLVETRNAKRFFIVDDLFGQQRHETIRFCSMLAGYQRLTRRRLRIMVQIRLDKARDRELLHAMRDAGINEVAIGYESPIPQELVAMNKRIRPEEMVADSREFHRLGFLVHGMFIYAYPMINKGTFAMPAAERVRHFKRFIRKAKLDTIQVLLPVPLPGTALRKRLAADNRVYPLKHLNWQYYDGNFPLFEPEPPFTPEQMQQGLKKIMGNFYRLKN
ncbi:MAG: radical SAM protein, partial [Chitinivibrionales bacterium]|nr:radical SAM protein [Chitinivibrionales bacterium]MBD3395335.1 radical SAM protein [Chitinivibrionales bacterium]